MTTAKQNPTNSLLKISLLMAVSFHYSAKKSQLLKKNTKQLALYS